MEGVPVVHWGEPEEGTANGIAEELRRKEDGAIGDFGLRKRRAASKEHLAQPETSPERGTSAAASKSLQEENERGHSQMMRMNRRLHHLKRGMFKPKRSMSDDVPKPPPPEQPKKEIDLNLFDNQGFTTADVHKGYDAAYIVFAMRDFILYLIYLMTLFAITIGSQYSAHNYYSKLVDVLLTKSNFQTPVGQTEYPGIVDDFEGIKTPQQLWSFITDILVKFIYDDADPLKRGSTVLMESVLVGVPSIRQLRVKNDTCETAPMFRDIYKTCYDYYSVDIEDRSNLDSPLQNSYPWEYVSDEILKKGTFRFPGVMGSYGGGGFQFNFTSSLSLTSSWLDELKNYNWIRMGTRYVTIDFVLYTPNTNLFCVTKLAFELIPTGGVISHHVLSTLKLFRYSTTFDFYILSAEVIFIAFTVYFTFEEGQQMYILKEDYLSNWWNILDICIIVLSYITIGLGIYRYIIVRISLSVQLLYIRTNNVSNFDSVTRIQELFHTMISLLLFIAWMKLLKFSSLNKSIVSIISVFSHVGEELITVTCMNFILTTGYAICGHVLFGFNVHEFINIRRSISSMLSIYVGKLDQYKICRQYNPVIAPIFFSTYILSLVVIYFNIYVGLLVVGYDKVRMFMNEDPDRLYLDDWIYSVVLHLLTLLKQYRLVTILMTKNLASRIERDYLELTQILKRHGIRGMELKLLLESYEVRKGVELNLDNIYELYNDVCTRNQLVNEVEDHNEILKVMDTIQKTIDHCDQAILDVITKTELLTDMMAQTVKPKVDGKKRKK